MQKLVKTKTVSETVPTRWAAWEEREGIMHACTSRITKLQTSMRWEAGTSSTKCKHACEIIVKRAQDTCCSWPCSSQKMGKKGREKKTTDEGDQKVTAAVN